jgi:hypothetical protein
MTAADDAIKYALNQVGKPYGWGKTGPAAYDCSGLVYMAYKSAGVNLPRTTGPMSAAGFAVSKVDLQPGDLVFPDPGHVQIYLGNGKIVEAPRTGLKIRVVDMWGFWRARRVAAPGTATVTATNTGLNLPNPLSAADDALNAVKQLISTIGEFGKVATFLADPANYLRLGMGAGGIILLLVAIHAVEAPNPVPGNAAKGLFNAAKNSKPIPT